MAKPLPRIDDVVARIKQFATMQSKTASAVSTAYSTPLAESMAKLAHEVRREAHNNTVTVQDVLDVARQVLR